MPWNDGLQGQALQIAATPNSPLCVVAGPGTGKTFALMRRLRHAPLDLVYDCATPARRLVRGQYPFGYPPAKAKGSVLIGERTIAQAAEATR